MDRMPRAIVFLIVAMAAILFSLPASAQTLSGTLVGNVTDESSLAVPGATVRITHAETNQTREAVTNSTGGYNFPNIQTRTSQVDVALTGFQSFSSRGVVVSQSTAVSCRREADRRHAAGNRAGVGHGSGAADRERRGADAGDERAD